MQNGARFTISGLIIALALVFATVTVVSKGTAAPDERAADEKALRDADREWSRAAAAKDLDRTVSYYADDAIVLPPNAPLAAGQEAFRREWNGMFAAFSGTLHWEPTKVEVSRGGDLAYIVGTYEGTLSSPNRNPAKDRGKYLEVWKKQPDGKWKCVADMFSSDLPATSSQ